MNNNSESAQRRAQSAAPSSAQRRAPLDAQNAASEVAAHPSQRAENQNPQIKGERIDMLSENGVSLKKSTKAGAKGSKKGEPAPAAHDTQKRTTRAKNAFFNNLPNFLKNPTELQVRIRTGGVYIALNILAVLWGNIPTAVVLAITAAICAGEFYFMLRADAKLPNEVIGVIAAAAYPLVTCFFGVEGIVIVSALFMLVLIIWYVFWSYVRIADVSVCLFGAVYTGMLICGLLVIRASLPEPWGGVLVLLLFASVWGNDAFAYLVGSAIGKHKLAPRVSPKKSWEGFIAGLVVSAAFWGLMTLVPGVNLSLPLAIVFGVVCGVMCMLGDLAESRIKRNVGVKDSGTIMPGHGGLLDRSDSMFLASITAACLLIFSGAIPFVFA